MKPKKTSAEWYVAATHYLTAGFVIPLILNLVLGILLGLLLNNFQGSLLAGFTKSIFPLLINILSIWLGVIYSSKYLDKTYVIKDANKIVVLATIYFLVIGAGYQVYVYTQRGSFSLDSIVFIADSIIFYVVSKTRIANNFVQEPSNVQIG